MADLSTLQPDDDSSAKSRHWLVTLTAIGGVFLVGGGILGWLGWRELKKQLPVIVSEELSGALGRPIKLGELQRLGFTGLRFGETIVPPTADNFTFGSAKITDISLNPWDLILRRTFRPSLLMIEPDIAIKQRFDREWVFERPNSADNEGTIRTEIGRIRIRNARVSVGPVTRQQIAQAPEGISTTELFIVENVNLNVGFSGEDNKQVSLRLGGRLKKGTFQIRGDGNIGTGNANFTLQGKKLQIDTLNPFLAGGLYLGKGYVYTNLAAEYRPEQDPAIAIAGSARLQNGQAIVSGLPSNFEDIYGRLRFRDQQATFEDATLRFGPIQAGVTGNISLQEGYQVALSLPDVSVDQVETAFDYSLPVPAAGRFAVVTRLLGPLEQPRFQGNLTNLNAVSVDRLSLPTVTADFSGDLETIFLDDFRVLPSTGGSITAKGQVNLDENILKIRGLPPTSVNLTANVDLPLDPLVELYGTDLPVQMGRLTAVANATGPLQNPTAVATWQLQEGIAVGSGQVDVAGTLATLTNTRLTVANSGTINATGQANLSTRQLNLNATARLPLDEIAQTAAIALPAGLTLGTMTADVNAAGPFFNPTGEALWQLAGGTVPGQGRLTYANQVIALRDTALNLGGGILGAAGQADLRSGFWDIGLAGNDLVLSAFSPQLVGSADLGIQASGSLRDLSPAGIRARGNMAFSEGLPLAIAGANTLIDGPLALSFDWDGSILGVPSLTAPGLAVNGAIATAINPATGLPNPDTINFAVKLSDYDLSRVTNLSLLADYNVPLRGRFDFAGTLTGPFRTPAVNANLALRDTALGPLSLLSDVQGSVNGSLQGPLNLSLAGEQTEIRADIDAERLPNTLLFRNGPLLVSAYREGDWLLGKVRDFPIEVLGIRPMEEPDLGVVGGILRSDFEVQLSTLFSNPTARASFGINRPGVGAFTATGLQGQLRLANWRMQLENTALAFPESRFDITAQADVRSPRAATARITTTNAQIGDVLTALHLYELSDLRTVLNPKPLGTAADLQTTPIETPPGDLSAQMQRAAAARELQAQSEQARNRALLPPLTDLQGTFAADISLAASPVQGVEMAFDINGQNWVWGQYDFANQFVARGALQDQVLTLDPIRLEAGDARINLTGQLARAGFDTQLEVANFDLAPIGAWLALPLPVEGKVNALATLRGTPGSPYLAGSATLDEAALNSYPLEIGSNFSYQDAWLRFDAEVKGEPDEPLLVQGQVPYALPFMTVQPDSDQLLVQVSLASGGFALLDMFKPYVAWGGGDANLLIEAQGPINQPDINGIVNFQEASIDSEFLGESLTNLNGSVGFRGDRIQVSGLQGSLVDGQFFLAGELPFLTATAARAPAAQPLTLTMDTLQFNFADEIQSQINGQVIVRNSLQTPVIGGEVNLAGIRVNIGTETLTLARDLLLDPGLEAVVANLKESRPGLNKVNVQLDNFVIRIPEPAEIRANPLLSVDAIGEVALSGPLTRPVGDGYIELLDGWLNTVTTNLFLVTGNRRNLITLTPDKGLNPYIDLQFEGALPLQRQYNLPSNHFAVGNTSEIPDLDPLASVTLFDEILIEAVVEGYLSEGSDVLQLSSTPSYSQERLFSMLTGGYLADLPSGEPTLALGTNLIFAFFTEQQEAIGDFFGLRRLRFGASTQLPEEDGDTFGVGVGVNVGITDSLSAGLVQVINQSQPYQLNLQYRLNNQMGIGGSTDFSGETRVFWQYRVSF